MVKSSLLWQRGETSGEENSAEHMFLNEKIQYSSNANSLQIYTETEPKQSILIPNSKFNMEKQMPESSQETF